VHDAAEDLAQAGCSPAAKPLSVDANQVWERLLVRAALSLSAAIPVDQK
jgi:hypothetical protein